MPKRPKAKVRTNPRPTEKTISPAKQRRIEKQLKAEGLNQTVDVTPWEKSKAKRTAMRKIQGKPLSWAIRQSKEKEKASVSNTRY